MSIMLPSESDENNGWPDGVWLAHNATDPYWSLTTGMCGGCGNADCHDGICPGNVNGYCTTCPTRRETGEVR